MHCHTWVTENPAAAELAGWPLPSEPPSEGES